jgi:hypothetical protein
MDADQAADDAEDITPAAAPAAGDNRTGIAQSLLSGLQKQRSRLDRRADKPPSNNDLEGMDAKSPEVADQSGVARPIISMDKAFANAAAEDEARTTNFSAFSTGPTLFPNQEPVKPESKKVGSAEDEAAHVKAKADVANARSQNEKQLMSQDKCYIRHRFDDLDERGNVSCKFQCQTYWAKQFEALRTCYFKGDDKEGYLRSLATSRAWAALGGKSGAAFSKSSDERLVIKCISRVELQMFLEFAPAYFGKPACAVIHDVLCMLLSL